MARELREVFGIQRVEKTLTIRKDATSLFRAWRRLTGIPAFMSNVISVHESGARSHWVVRAAHGNASWNAVLTDEIPGRLIAWRSLDAAPLANAAEVWFQSVAHGKATEVRFVLAWEVGVHGFVPGIATIGGLEPTRQVEEDLHRFKRLMETGNVPTIHGQPRGGLLRAPDRFERYTGTTSNLVTQAAAKQLGSGELSQ